MAQSGNGVDLAAIYQLLIAISGRLDSAESALNQLVGTVNEHTRRFDEVAAVLENHGRKFEDLFHGLTDLRDAVGQYHYSVVGQGIAVNQLEERVKLLEEHLGLDPTG